MNKKTEKKCECTKDSKKTTQAKEKKTATTCENSK